MTRKHAGSCPRDRMQGDTADEGEALKVDGKGDLGMGKASVSRGGGTHLHSCPLSSRRARSSRLAWASLNPVPKYI